MHVAAENGCEIAVIEALFLAYPDSLRAKESHGLYPFQSAATSSDEASLDVIYFLLRMHPVLVVE